jgi:hypothetical protein
MSTYERDPHLPPPEVCDWLLRQEWGHERALKWRAECPGRRLVLESGIRHGNHESSVAIGANEIGYLQLCAEALEVLREDAERRDLALPLVPKAVQSSWHSDSAEDDLLRRVLEECKNTDLSAVHAVGVLHSAATLMLSKCFNLSDREDDDQMVLRQDGDSSGKEEEHDNW